MTELNKKKRKELANYLDIPENQITLKDEDSNDKYNEYFVEDDGTYYVMDEDESREAAYEDIEGCVDDMGLSAFSKDFQERILDNYLEDRWFEEVCKEDYENYVNDIESENSDTYANRLVEECIDAGIIDDDEIDEDGEYTGDKDLQEELSEYLYEKVGENYSSYAAWYNWTFGEDEMRWAVKEGYVNLNMDDLVDECIEVDGYGHFISRYDGETIELDKFYAYKIDD